MANSDLSRDETMRLVEYMFHEAGLNKNSSITPEDFAKVFKDQMDMFRDVHLDFKGMTIRHLMIKKGYQRRQLLYNIPLISIFGYSRLKDLSWGVVSVL